MKCKKGCAQSKTTQDCFVCIVQSNLYCLHFIFYLSVMPHLQKVVVPILFVNV